MRLHDFILTRREQILVEWEAFARTCSPASITMDVKALRDHASEMLTVMAADLETYQGALQQAQKSMGQASASEAALTAAGEHGAERARSGFTMTQMVAEYRALRASVLRLWTRECGELKTDDLGDLIRFNEAIDQALAESIAEFTESVDHAKEMFLAILGHDLRNPLGAILVSATFMYDTGELDRAHVGQMAVYARRATQMVSDLLDFTRSQLGEGIPVHPTEVDMGEIMRGVVDEVGDAHPEGDVRLQPSEGEIGFGDTERLRQALTNLLVNAVEHGAPGTPVRVEITGDEEDVSIRIHNEGTAISADRLDGIFNPMKGSTKPFEHSTHRPTGNLGLGLYIAERIVHAHGGRIEIDSSEGRGTTFTVRLPRDDDGGNAS